VTTESTQEGKTRNGNHPQRFSALSFSSFLLFLLSLAFIGGVKVPQKRGAQSISEDDIRDASGFASYLSHDSDTNSQQVSQHIWNECLPPRIQHVLTNSTTCARQKRKALAQELDRIVRTDTFCRTQRFIMAPLTKETLKVRDSTNHADLIRFPRMFLEDIYPRMLRRTETFYWPHAQDDDVIPTASDLQNAVRWLPYFAVLFNILRLMLSFLRIEDDETMTRRLCPREADWATRILSVVELIVRTAAIAVMYFIINLFTGTDLPRVFKMRGEFCWLAVILFALFCAWDLLTSWLFRKTASPILSVDDFRDFPSFVEKLKSPHDRVSDYVLTRLSETSRQCLAKWPDSDSGSVSKPIQEALVRDLNTIIHGVAIGGEKCFAGVALRRRTKKLEKLGVQNRHEEDLARLNRLLLEDAYPRELSRNWDTFVKDDYNKVMVIGDVICLSVCVFYALANHGEQPHPLLGFIALNFWMGCSFVFLIMEGISGRKWFGKVWKSQHFWPRLKISKSVVT